MATLRLTGRVNTEGKLQVELPPGIPPGEVEVIITFPESDDVAIPEWTDQEIQDMLRVTPQTGAEIARLIDEMEAGFDHITDSAAWVEEQRRSQREGSQW